MNFYILIGLPRAGQDVWASQKINELTNEGVDVIYLNKSEDMRQELEKGKTSAATPMAYAVKVAKALEGKTENIILDGDYCAKDSRFPMLEFADAAINNLHLPVRKIAVNFLTSYGTCLRNIKKLGIGLNLPVFQRAAHTLEYGSFEEGFDEIIEIDYSDNITDKE